MHIAAGLTLQQNPLSSHSACLWREYEAPREDVESCCRFIIGFTWAGNRIAIMDHWAMINVHLQSDLADAFVCVGEAEAGIDDCCIGKGERKSSKLS